MIDVHETELRSKVSAAVAEAQLAEEALARAHDRIVSDATRQLQLQAYSLLPMWRRWFTSVEKMSVDKHRLRQVIRVWTRDSVTVAGYVEAEMLALRRMASYGAAAQVAQSRNL